VPRALLFHWDREEARERLARLRAAGSSRAHMAEGGNPALRRACRSPVAATGLAAGLVDFKICALDPTWAGLRFTRRA
jgi:hypothetical protein